MEHLIIILDNEKKVDPKKYSCPIENMSKQEAINAAKKSYEKSYNNFNYESYYFTHKWENF